MALIQHCHTYPSLSRMALDYLTVPSMYLSLLYYQHSWPLDSVEPLTKVGVNQVRFRGETPRESDWGCQSIPWLLYTIILYVHVGIKSTNTV